MTQNTDKIKHLEDLLRKNVAAVNDIEMQLATEKAKCTQHEFVAEDNGDFHRPGYYYSCKKCDYFTRRKPESFKWS